MNPNFNDYSGSRNHPETGNELLTNPVDAAIFVAAFKATNVQNELYPPGAYTTSQYNVAYQEALLDWALGNTGCSAPSTLLLDDDEEQPF